MDTFYLENAALYKGYIEKLDMAKPPPHFVQQPGRIKKSTETLHDNPNMLISVRIRPMLENDDDAGFPRAIHVRPRLPGAQHYTVDLHDLYKHPRHKMPILRTSTFQAEKVFDTDASTETVYQQVVSDLLLSAMDGQLGTLFAYGQTGSGKTFTISQLQMLAVSELMDRNATVSFTIVELAGNNAFDLLNSRKQIAVREDASGNTQLTGAIEHQVKDVEEALKTLETAASFRMSAPTLRNDASSRSHSICRMRIVSQGAPPEQAGVLYMVDLAGSEAARDVAEHGPDRMRETRANNTSLSVLKDCIRSRAAAVNGKKVHVPIRGSMLTKVLKHVFDPNSGQTCKTTVIACLNPCLADIASSKNTFRYVDLLAQMD